MSSLGLRRERDGGDGARSDERGFTIVELLIALLVLAIILAALAPAFYGTMRAADLADEHSQASGIAVAASEQMRSFPYWQTGYTAADYQSGGVANPCIAASSSPTVQVDTSAFDASTVNGVVIRAALPTTQSINNITYHIQRCAYWVNSSIGSLDKDAFKQLVVTVSWAMGQIHSSVSQSSTLYPGGEGSYQYPDNNYPPGSTTTTSAPATPSAPTWVSYATSPCSPLCEVDLVWAEPSNSPVAAAKYIVDYTDALHYGGSGYLNLTPGTYTEPPAFNTPGTAANPNAIDVAPSTTYYIEVWAVASDGTKSTAPSNVVSVATGAASGGCTLSNLVVNPTTANVDANSKLAGFDSFSLSVNASGSCNTVTVAYTETGSTVYQATMSGSGTLTGTAGVHGDKWDTGNHPFTAYLNGSQYSPPGGGAVQVQVDITQCKNC